MTPAERMVAQFDRISEAPNAVARLRRFVLDLAVQGKTVAQDPSDEAASILVERIQVEKRDAGIRATKLAALNEAEVPYAAPDGWVWARIGQITSDRGQVIPSESFTYIDVSSIDKEVGLIADPKVLSASDAPSRARKLAQKGDVLYSCVRPYLLNVAVIDRDFVPPPIASTAFAILNGFGLIVPRYLWIALRSPAIVSQVESKMRGQSYPAINDSDFRALPLPLPPLAEQHRIVAKVDELMGLCDRLEAAQEERERRRDRLVSASLARLNQPADIPTFREYARFHLQQLPRMTSSRGYIQQLRETILNLGVLGRLEAQEPSDEPVFQTLGKLRGGSQNKSIATGAQQESYSTVPTLPATWARIALGSVCKLVTSGSRGWAEFYSDVGAKFIRAQNVRFGKLRVDNLACVAPPKTTEGTRTRISGGDLLVVITGAGVTNPALVDEELGEAYVSQHVAVVRPAVDSISPWILLCLMAPAAGRATLVERAYGAGKPGLNLETIRALLIPFPPLREQQRILSKLGKLMSTCDRLEAHLEAGRAAQTALLEATLGTALIQGRSRGL